ncbi:MAG TPA: hypothetical protein VH640_14495 [Bryobacteraceae bacterium]
MPRSAPLSVEQVVQMSREGVSEDLIVTSIKKNGKPFDLNTDEILELRKLGVSDVVIKLLLDPSQPYTPPPPPAKPPESAPIPQAKPVPAKKYPEDAYASRVPAEPGLYSFPQNSPVKVEIKILLGEISGAGLGKVLMKKGKVTAYLVGPSAKVRAPEGNSVFYIRLPEGKSIEELLLVAFDRKDGRRELDMGAPGAKPEMKPESLRQFDSLEVGPGLYRLNPAKLGMGEFMFYLIGTADPSKGNYGKGYDFGTGTVLGKKH